jgi:hypothetical protein
VGYRKDPETGDTVHCELCGMFPSIKLEEWAGGAIEVCERCANRRTAPARRGVAA